MGDQPVHLCKAFRGQVVPVANTAGKCAYTPQYEGLEEICTRYRERRLVVAGFPGQVSPDDERLIVAIEALLQVRLQTEFM
jgi:glutathione peroxidase-family protein